MVRCVRRRIAEIPMLLFSALACLFFVTGLVDTRRVELEWVQAPPPPLPETERDATLQVVVRARGGGPVERATVQAFWENERRYFWAGAALSDGDGRAELSRVPRGVLWSLADAPQMARSSLRVELGEDEKTVELELDAEQRLAVRVVDETGAPLPRATVLVTSRDPLPLGALTDADGRVEIGRLPPSPWTVKASAPGYESVERGLVRDSVEIALRRLGSLRVEVRDPAGKPAAGAIVSIAGSSLWPARRTEAGPDGVAKIVGLLAGAYDLKATLGSLVSPPFIGYELARGANDSLTLVLEQGRLVTAVVTDGEGPNPVIVPNADVVLAEGGLGSFPLRGRTGADGKVTLGPISPGPATLAARARGFVGGAVVAVPDVLTEPIRVPLLRGATLRGEVVDSRGFPIDGASIEIVGTDLRGMPVAETPFASRFRGAHFAWALGGPVPLIPAGELGVMPGPVPPIPAPGAAPSAPTDPFLLATDPRDANEFETFEPWVSGSDGRFVARPVTPGRVRALVRHPAYVEGTSELVSLAPGGEAEVRVVLLQGGTLMGRVLDDRGMPVADAEVEISGARSGAARATLTASDGTFEFAAVPPEVVLSVTRREDVGRIALRKTVKVPEGERVEIELTLPAPRDAVRIVVTDEDGQPIELAEVNALSLDPAVPLRSTLFTDQAGEAMLHDALGLALRVTVRAPGAPTAVKSFASAPETVSFELSPGVLVQGSVTAVRGRVSVAQALVTLVVDGERKTALTGADGTFLLRDVPEGRARLTVSHPDYADAEQTVTISATGRSDRPFELEPVDLEEPGEISGTVFDEDGNPVSGARVSLGSAASYLPVGALPRGTAVTDGRGHFTLSGVRPGVHRVEAIAAVVGRGSVSGVRVEARRTTDDVELTLKATASDEDTLASGGLAVTLGERGRGPELEVVVVQVSEGSEAERAGLREGDVLLGVDGSRALDMRDARTRLSGAPGSDVVLEISRGGETLRLRVAREAVRR
jgi:protocatechuate 3,4-dioxygenase beta subunit